MPLQLILVAVLHLIVRGESGAFSHAGLLVLNSWDLIANNMFGVPMTSRAKATFWLTVLLGKSLKS